MTRVYYDPANEVVVCLSLLAKAPAESALLLHLPALSPIFTCMFINGFSVYAGRNKINVFV